MPALITDRTQADLDVLTRLAAKGCFLDFTDEEKSIWLGGISQLYALDGSLEALDGTLYTVGDDGVRGAYNTTDYNRVETAVAYLDAVLRAMGYVAGIGSIKTSWTVEDLANETELARYLGNVRAIRDRLYLSNDLPDSMGGLTLDGANAIEKALTAADDAAAKIPAAYIHSGTTYSGLMGVRR